MSRILIVDDEASIGWSLREFLSDEGHEVELAASAEEGLERATAHRPDAVLIDVRLPGIDGITALSRFRDQIGRVPVVVITAFGSLETAVRSLDGGAFDYLIKPFGLDDVAAVIRRALEAGRKREPEAAAGTAASDEPLVGSGPAMQELFKSIALVAGSDVPVLITGESGTGKEVVARAIHRHGHRRAGPFVPITLAALSPGLVERELFGHVKGSFTGADHDRRGLLELADGGTILLDEIGDVSPDLQVKLLRAIERREVTPVGDARPRPVDIRVIAATHRPLGELIASGRFREDLYYRLSVFPIHLPPLRDRRDDIPTLAEHFLRLARGPGLGEGRLSAGALDELRARPWSGNVRELRNAIEHAALLARGGPILPEHLPAPRTAVATEPTPLREQIPRLIAEWTRLQMAAAGDTSAPSSLQERLLELAEPPLLRTVLEICRNNRVAAAEILGIHRTTLRQKMQRYGIE